MKDVVLGTKTLGYMGQFIIDPTGIPIARHALTAQVLKVNTMEWESDKAYNVIIQLPDGTKLIYRNDYNLDHLEVDSWYRFTVKVLLSKNGERDYPIITSQVLRDRIKKLTPIEEYMKL